MHRSIHGEKSVCSMPGGEELGLKQEGASRGQQRCLSSCRVTFDPITRV